MKKIITIILILTISSLVDANDNISLNESTKKTESSIFNNISDNIKINGLIETQLSYKTIDNVSNNQTNQTDASLSKIELNIKAKLHDYSQGFLKFLYEDEEKNIKVDEGGIFFGNTEKFPIYLKVGKFILPFGARETNFITDPFTVNLGETNKGAIEAGFENEFVYLKSYVFSSDYKKEDSKNKNLNYGGFIGIDAGKFIDNETKILLSISYISSLHEAEMFKSFAEENNFDKKKETVAGSSLALNLDFKGFVMNAEYMFALNNFDAVYYGLTKNNKTKTYNTEIGYKFNYLEEKEVLTAIRYEKAKDTLNDGSFKSYGIVIFADLFKVEKLNTLLSISLEYMHKKQNEGEKLKENSFITQLSAKF